MMHSAKSSFNKVGKHITHFGSKAAHNEKMRRPFASLRHPATWGPPPSEPATRQPRGFSRPASRGIPPRHPRSAAAARRRDLRGVAVAHAQRVLQRRSRSRQRGEPSPQRLPAVSRVCGGASGCATSSLWQGAGTRRTARRRRGRGGCGRGEGGAEVVAGAEKEEQRWRRRVEEEQGWPHAQRRSWGGRKICVKF